MREERIGHHRLFLGDAAEIIPTISGIDCIVTDPPYGMAFRSNYRAKQWGFIANDGDDWAMKWTCSLGARHSKYVWMRWDNLQDVPKPNSLITWVKDNHSMGDLEHEHGRQTEVCAFYRGPYHFFPGKRPTDVIRCPRSGNNYHPTEKPVGLMSAVIEWTDGAVIDPFMGSGSTIVAAARAGRPSVGIEIDPDHFETACRRLEEAMRQPSLFSEGK